MSVALMPGIYWLTAAMQGTNACGTVASANTVPIPAPVTVGTGHIYGLADGGSTTGALPATYTATYYQAASSAGSAVTRVFVKVA